MAKEIEIDLSKFAKDLEKAGGLVGLAARSGVQKAMMEWKHESINVAPIHMSTLRRSIHSKTERGGANGLDITGEIRASAIETSRKWGRFDYAYYIHEVKGNSFRGRTPGTIGKFFDVPAEKHEAAWIRDIEDNIKQKIREAGF